MAKRLRIYRIALFALCVIATILLFSACAKNEHVHSYGEWEVRAATCEAAGQRTRRCGECGAVQTEPIEKLGHDWQEVEVIKKATCEEDGLMSAACGRCDAHEDEQVVSALGHDWQTEKIEEETCLHGGRYLHTCKRADCSATKTTTTQPVDHKWSLVSRVEATCESNGSATYKCDYGCQTPREDTLAAIGHSFGDSYTVDVEPTYDTEGKKSKHCSHSGCIATNDPQTIPRKEVTYSVTIKDSCGSYYYGSATVEFYVKGELVESAPMADSRVNTITLHSPDCNVKLSGLNKGYSAAQDGYDLSEEQPDITVRLGASLMDAPKEQLPFYKTGSVLYDQEYTYYGANNVLETTTLKDILAVKKGIIMNFYFNGCPPCNSEMQGLIKISREYQDDIAIIMVNYYDTEKDLLAFRDRNNAADTPLMFLNVDSSKYTFRDFASVVKSFPTSAFIDCNGQVVMMHVGGISQSGFGSYIKSYILNRYDILHPTQTNSLSVTSAAEAILPSKKFGF